jgi:hypothetical protein
LTVEGSDLGLSGLLFAYDAAFYVFLIVFGLFLRLLLLLFDRIEMGLTERSFPKILCCRFRIMVLLSFLCNRDNFFIEG